MTWHEQVPRHERLVDALSDDILDATDGDVLASHTTGAARVVADALRQALQRAIGRATWPVEVGKHAPLVRAVQPDRDDGERR